MDWVFTKTSTVRPHFSPTMPILHNIQSSGSGQNNNYNNYVRNRNKPTIITELQLNLRKYINICCCSFSKISILKRKNCCKKVWPNDKFWCNDKFLLFFDLITWDTLMVWAWNLVCGRFINFRNRRKILNSLTFGCPSYYLSIRKLVLWKTH